MKKIEFLKWAFMTLLCVSICSCSSDNSEPEDAVVPEKPENPDPAQPTEITGGKVSGVWKANSTITVKGSFEIPAGSSLTIEKGVKVIIEKNDQVPVEIMVYGDLYCYGEEGNEIQFTVPDSEKNGTSKRVWGGIFGADKQAKAPNMVFQYTVFEYTGALTTNNSYSAHTFKSTVGKGVPAINTMDENTNLVIQHCTFRNNGQDGLYMQGGNMIITNNVFEGQGDEAGGEAVNFKAGIKLDLAYNLFYGPSNSAAKLSGTTDNRTPGSFTVFNNTVVNGGGRKNKADLGSFALESGCNAYIYNNLIVNCKWGILNNLTDPAHTAVASNNWYYAYSQENVDRYQETAENKDKGTGVLKGEQNAIKGGKAGENDPGFVAYDVSTPTTTSKISSSFDFHLKSGSAALKAGASAETIKQHAHFVSKGLTIDGKTYYTPTPSIFCGAFGTK